MMCQSPDLEHFHLEYMLWFETGSRACCWLQQLHVITTRCDCFYILKNCACAL